MLSGTHLGRLRIMTKHYNLMHVTAKQLLNRKLFCKVRLSDIKVELSAGFTIKTNMYIIRIKTKEKRESAHH